MILTGKYETVHVHVQYDQGYSSSKQIEKENKPQQKVIGLDNTIKGHFRWFKKGMENNIFWSER